jgi:heme/copper-type cytochrome/quinol oxidase subunit 2
MPMIDALTPEQKRQLSKYRRKSRKKWNRIIRSTNRIDLDNATSVVAQVYAQLGLPAPKILFFPSPDAAWKPIQLKLTRHRWLTRLLRKSTTLVTAISAGSGCISAFIFFPFALLYGLLRHVEFLSAFLNIIATTIGLLTLTMLATGFIFLLLGSLTYCLEKLELKWNRYQLRQKFGQRLTPHFTWTLIQQLQHQFAQQISSSVWDDIAQEERFFRSTNARQIWSKLDRPIYEEWQNQYGCFEEKSQPSEFRYFFDFPIALAGHIGFYDFCVSILQCDHNPSHLRTLHDLMQKCSFILPFEKICVLCNRPVKFSLDSKTRLHALNEPAFQFADGSCLYFHHGLKVR